MPTVLIALVALAVLLWGVLCFVLGALWCVSWVLSTPLDSGELAAALDTTRGKITILPLDKMERL